MKAGSLALKVLVAGLAFTASLWAQDGLRGALSRVRFASPVHLEIPFSQTLAAADFDGDNKPDGALLVDYGLRLQSSFRTIELHFTRRENTDLVFESNETPLAVSALDVNRDGATDIVVEQPLTHKRLQIWLNDGRGSFHRVRTEDFPDTHSGTAERLELPLQRADFPACALPPQPGSDGALFTAYALAYAPCSCQEQALASESTISPQPVAANSSRAPPLFHPL